MLYDKDIREPLFDFCEEQYGRVRILEEQQIGSSRADVMMVTEGALVGIEIKSDADTYVRLARQVRDYNLYFDYNIVAVGTSHAMHIKEHVPDWWGIITIEEVDGKVDFYIYRAMSPNPAVNRLLQLSMMWRPELARIQAANQMCAYTQKSKRFVMEKILDLVPEEVLKPQMCRELFERDYTTIHEQINRFRTENGMKPRRRRPAKKRRRRKL